MNARQKAKHYKKLYEKEKIPRIAPLKVFHATADVEWIKCRSFSPLDAKYLYGDCAEKMAIDRLRRQIADAVAKKAKVIAQDKEIYTPDDEPQRETMELLGTEYVCMIGIVNPPAWYIGGKEVPDDGSEDNPCD